MAEETAETVASSTEQQTVTESAPVKTEETPSTTEAQSQSSGEDWWDTNGLDDKVATRIKSIRSEYTKKSQEASQLKNESERARQLEQQLGHVTDQIRGALLSPNYMDQIEQARRQLMTQMGVSSGQMVPKSVEPPRPKKLESAEDLLDYWTQREQWQEQKLRQEYDLKLANEINRLATPIAKDRWQSADQSLRSKYPLYEKYSSRVLQSVASGPYQGLYTKGMDEKQVLETAFRSLAFEDMQTLTRQDALKSVEAKKNAVTERPKKAMSTVSGNSKSKEDIISELRRKGLSFEVTQ